MGLRARADKNSKAKAVDQEPSSQSWVVLGFRGLGCRV